MKKIIFIFLALFSLSNNVKATGNASTGNASTEKKEVFNPSETAMHHIKDLHQFNILGDAYTLYLPVILLTHNGIVSFSSKEFQGDDSGKIIVEKKGQKFIKFHEKIYYAYTRKNLQGEYIKESSSILHIDDKHHPINDKPWDFSITKNVFSLWLSIFILGLSVLGAARFYRSKKYKGIPKGIASLIEPIVVFVRDDIAIPNIGRTKYKKYMPYLLTIFFFIWLNNVIGLIPFFPFGSNVTGNIAVTFILAIITFLITTFSGNKNYWKHIFWTPGVPIPMKIFLAPIEVIGMFSKPFSLMIRLFANITAGHIIIISLISLIFIFQSYWVSPLSVLAAVFMNLIEVLVTALQAYIFTILSALYFGMAVEDKHE